MNNVELISINNVELASIWTTLSWSGWITLSCMASMNNVKLASLNKPLSCLAWTMLSTMLFSHDNNGVTTLFSHHCCIITCWQVETTMSTTVNMVVLSNTNFPVSNSHEQPRCFIIAQQYCWNNAEQNVGPTMLLTHANNVVQALFRQQSCDNLWNF